MDNKQPEIISKKLDKIIALLTIQNISNIDNKIYALKRQGLNSEEIGLLVNIKNIRQTRGWKRK